MQHLATGGNFTRTFDYVTNSNRVNKITVDATDYDFSHDDNGNILSEGDTARKLTYDYADRLKSFAVQTGTAEPSQYALYLYDGGGNRVKKLVRKQGGGVGVSVYIDGIFEYRKETSFTGAIPDLEVGVWVIGEGDGEQNTLHIMDGNSRIATRRLGDALGDTTPDIKYNLEDHLGSSNLLLDTDGAVVSTEEYYPFGETSFGSYGKKRYRFCGKERDEESGLYYYGMRYYSAWTCRFISVDPLAGKYPFYTPYQYAGNQPINSVDLDGLEQNPKTATTPQGNGQQGANNTGASSSGGSSSGGLVKGEKLSSQKLNNIKNFVENKLPAARQEAKQKSDDARTNKLVSLDPSSTKVDNLEVAPKATVSPQIARNRETGVLTGTYEGPTKAIEQAIEEHPIAAALNPVTAIYKIADQANVSFTGHHFSGQGAFDNEIRDAKVSTFITLVTFGMASAESNAAKGTGSALAEMSAVENTATNTGGRLGNIGTRSQVNDIASTLESRGYTISGGGGRAPEEYLRPLGGGRSGGSYIDITADHPIYGRLRINTVDVLKNKITPSARELRNAERIRQQIGTREHLLLIPKK